MVQSIYSNSLTLRALKREFDKQVFAIPELQRVFVWDKNKICKLMDSIYYNYPIGVALLWEIDRDKSIIVRHNEIAIPPFDPHRNKKVRFIIDGQQRLSVIHNILNGNIVFSKNQEIDFNKVYFSLDPEYEKTFYYLKRNEDKNLVSLTTILQKSLSWFSGKYNKSQCGKILICKEQFLNYRFYFLVTTTTQIEEVRETFVRINSLGTPISSSDRAFARATNIDLRKLVSTLKTRFSSGFENIPDRVILATIGLIEGANEVGEKAIEHFINKIIKKELEEKDFQKKWRKIEHAIGAAIDYLKVTFEVDDYRYLPSDNMLATLSCFYFFNNRQPDARQRIEIKKWFWHTGIASRYSGRGFRKNILADVEFFNKIAKYHSHKYVVTEKLSTMELLNTDYSKNTSLGTAYYLLLKIRSPKYLDNGEPIVLSDYSTIANRSDKHHIFPRAFLTKRGVVRKKINSIVNICFLAAKENQKIGGSVAPAVYLQEFKRKRYFPQVMTSNLIPYKNSSSLWKAGKTEYSNFLFERLKLIVDALEKTAGVKIFDRRS